MKFIKSIGNVIFVLLIFAMFGSIIYAKSTGNNSNGIGLLFLMLLLLYFILYIIIMIIRYVLVTMKKYGKIINRVKGLKFLYLLWIISLFCPILTLVLHRQTSMIAIASYYYGTFFVLWYACLVTTNCMKRCICEEKASLILLDFIPDIYSSERRVR